MGDFRFYFSGPNRTLLGVIFLILKEAQGLRTPGWLSLSTEPSLTKTGSPPGPCPLPGCSPQAPDRWLAEPHGKPARHDVEGA